MKPGSFFQKHPGADFYSLFWLLVFLVLAGLGRFFPPLWIPALVALVYLLFRIFSKNAELRCAWAQRCPSQPERSVI